MKPLRFCLLPLALAASVTWAHGPSAESSALSALPIAVSVAAPLVLVSGAAVLTVTAVQASAEGTVYVLENASDGSRASVRMAGDATLAVGTALHCTAVRTGTVLSTGGRAVAIIPNAAGDALLYQERVTP